MPSGNVSIIQGDQVFNGNVAFEGDVALPDGAVNNAAFSASPNDRLSQEKQVHRLDLNYSQKDGTAVVAETKLLRIAQGAGKLLGVDIRPTAVPGSATSYTIDVQTAADGSSSWTSLLNAAVTVDSAKAANTLISAVLAATPTFAVGAAIRVVVTVTGGGTQGQGFVASIAVQENPF